jgi:hypothetical protein
MSFVIKKSSNNKVTKAISKCDNHAPVIKMVGLDASNIKTGKDGQTVLDHINDSKIHLTEENIIKIVKSNKTWIASKVEPSTEMLWIDTSNINNVLIKWHNGSDWVAISGNMDNANSIKNNFESTTYPRPTDDTSEGYSVGSMWINTNTKILYICMDSAVGSAVWIPISGKAKVGCIENIIAFIFDNTHPGRVEGQKKFMLPRFESKNFYIELSLNGIELIRNYDYIVTHVDKDTFVELINPTELSDLINGEIYQMDSTSAVIDFMFDETMPGRVEGQTKFPLTKLRDDIFYEEISLNGIELIKDVDYEITKNYATNMMSLDMKKPTQLTDTINGELFVSAEFEYEDVLTYPSKLNQIVIQDIGGFKKGDSLTGMSLGEIIEKLLCYEESQEHGAPTFIGLIDFKPINEITYKDLDSENIDKNAITKSYTAYVHKGNLALAKTCVVAFPKEFGSISGIVDAAKISITGSYHWIETSLDIPGIGKVDYIISSAKRAQIYNNGTSVVWNIE